jgi:hypothetical protein
MTLPLFYSLVEKSASSVLLSLYFYWNIYIRESWLFSIFLCLWSLNLSTRPRSWLQRNREMKPLAYQWPEICIINVFNLWSLCGNLWRPVWESDMRREALCNAWLIEKMEMTQKWSDCMCSDHSCLYLYYHSLYSSFRPCLCYK